MVGVAELRAATAADRLAHLLADAVGARARSVVLHGSLSAGGFRPGRSDIDLLAVVDSGLADAQAAVVERLVRRRALVGPAPHEVIASVPADWIVERGRYWLMTWRSRTDDTRHAAFMVLTACRIWRFAVEHVHCPKADAARWALGRDASLVVVRQALQQYEHDPASVVDQQGIAGLLDAVLDETARTR